MRGWMREGMTVDEAFTVARASVVLSSVRHGPGSEVGATMKRLLRDPEFAEAIKGLRAEHTQHRMDWMIDPKKRDRARGDHGRK